MKIVVLSPWYPTLEKPSYGIFVKEQTTALLKLKQNIKPSVLYYNDNLGYNLFKFITKKNVIDNEIKTNEFPVFYKEGLHFPLKCSVTRTIWIREYLKLFKKYLSKHGKPDIVHAHTYWGGLIALKIKEKYNIPYIITEHSSSLISKNETLNIDLIKKAYSGASELIAVGASLKESMNLYTNIKINIIPNSIDTTFFKPDLNHKPTDKIHIITIGGLINIKQTHLAIKTVTVLFKKGYNISLNIIGDGELYDNLNELINELDAEKYIKLQGSKNRDEIKSFLNDSNIYIHTSKKETFGIVLIEAMAMGLPIISTKSGGPEGFINNDVGVLVDNDVESISKSLEVMIKNLNNYHSKEIRNSVIENFNDDIITNKIVNIYKSVLNK